MTSRLRKPKSDIYTSYLVILLATVLVIFSIPLLSGIPSPGGRFVMGDIYDIKVGDSIIFAGRNATLEGIAWDGENPKVSVAIDGMYRFVIPLSKNITIKIGDVEAQLIDKISDNEIRIRISQTAEQVPTSKIFEVTLKLGSLKTRLSALKAKVRTLADAYVGYSPTVSYLNELALNVEIFENNIDSLIAQLKSNPNDPQTFASIKSALSDMRSEFIEAVGKVI